jgi:uridine kinase
MALACAGRQEGVSAEDTITAYRSIYFPAQEIHVERDAPRSVPTAIVNNDPATEAR